MVPYAIPGETVSVSITHDKKDFCFASIDTIIEKDHGRTRADCPYFTRCGGCSFLHVAYDRELEFKKIILEDSLVRIAGLGDGERPDIEVVHAGRYHYRSHATLKAKDGIPGFFRKGTNDFVPIGEKGCLLLAEELNIWLRENKSLPDDCRIAIDSSSRVITSFQKDPIVIDKAGGYIFTRTISSFFQSNSFLRDRMLEIVRNHADRCSFKTFLDIGCGGGFFSLALAGLVKSGTGIDISGENIRWARHNAKQNRITNVEFLTMPSNRIHPERLHADLIVTDPPRAGIDKQTRQTIMTINPSMFAYVSCNPATFSRDAKDFIRGGYTLEKLTLIDMFPGTHHIELISLFRRGTVSPSA